MRAGDAAGLVQIDDAVGQHLGVHAQIAHAAFLQQSADGIRHAADPDLDAGAVFHLARDLPGDRMVDIAGRRIAQLGGRRVIALDDIVDLADMHAIVDAEAVRQSPGLLDDHDPGAFDEGAVPGVGRAEIEDAVFVHRTGLEDHDIGRLDEAAVVVGNLAQIERDVVAASGVVLDAVIAAEVPVEGVKMQALRVGFEDGARFYREARTELDVVRDHRRAPPEPCRRHRAG